MRDSACFVLTQIRENHEVCRRERVCMDREFIKLAPANKTWIAADRYRYSTENWDKRFRPGLFCGRKQYCSYDEVAGYHARILHGEIRVERSVIDRQEIEHWIQAREYLIQFIDPGIGEAGRNLNLRCELTKLQNGARVQFRECRDFIGVIVENHRSHSQYDPAHMSSNDGDHTFKQRQKP
jgi:hypothetical protein